MTNDASNQTIIIKDSTANPAPLGLLGFGMTTILLNIHNAGIYELDSMMNLTKTSLFLLLNFQESLVIRLI